MIEKCITEKSLKHTYQTCLLAYIPLCLLFTGLSKLMEFLPSIIVEHSGCLDRDLSLLY